MGGGNLSCFLRWTWKIGFVYCLHLAAFDQFVAYPVNSWGLLLCLVVNACYCNDPSFIQLLKHICMAFVALQCVALAHLVWFVVSKLWFHVKLVCNVNVKWNFRFLIANWGCVCDAVV